MATEHRTLARLTFYAYKTIMIVHYLFAYGKSDSRSFKFVLAVKALKYLENLFDIAFIRRVIGK